MGNTVFWTSNWYAAVSTNGGASFSYINPYTTFPSINSGFCCDQIVHYAPRQDMMLWLLQYLPDNNTGTQRLAFAVGSAAVANNTWNYVDLNPQLLGYANGNWLDFPTLTVGSTYLYGTSNVFTVAGGNYAGSVLWRIPLADLAGGGQISYQFAARSESTIRCTEGAATTMYCAMLYATNRLRVFSWPDNGNLTTNDVTITPYTWLSRDGIATTVGGTNWAARADSRILGAWNAKGVIGLMWSARQDANHPFPYTIIARVDEATKQLIEQVSIWHPQYAWMYPSVSVNAAGDVAGVIYVGGGNLFPQAQHWIVDYASPSFTTFENYHAASSLAGPNSNSWGDYSTVRAHKTKIHTWVGAMHVMGAGGNDDNSVGRYTWFGREGDFGATNRPSVTTGAATNLARTSATLNGTVNPNGTTTNAYFRYGLTTSYSSSTASQNVGAGTSPLAVNPAVITSLSCGTVYHYLLSAANNGESTGGDRTFTTSPCVAPTVATTSASAIGASTATLNGTVNPNGLSTTTGFDYGTTTAYGSSVAAATLSGTTTQAMTAGIASLTCGRQYHFRAKGTSSSGSSVGTNVSFSTSACVPPSISVHPLSQEVPAGQAVLLGVTATGTPTLSYQWYLGVSSTTTSPISGATGASYQAPGSTTTKRYWVRVSSPYGTANSATAVLSLAFTDSLVAGTSPIRIAHINELRDRVNAVRQRLGLPPFQWTDPTLVARATRVLAVHITELRTALAQAYDRAKVLLPTYTDPTLSVGTPIRRVHIVELRNALIALE